MKKDNKVDQELKKTLKESLEVVGRFLDKLEGLVNLLSKRIEENKGNDKE